MPEIKHIWLDFDGTLTHETDEYRRAHDEYAAKLFAKLVGLTEEDNYVDIYVEHRKREGLNTKVFENIAGQSKGYWAKKHMEWDNALLYDYDDHADIRNFLISLAKGSIPISIFTNTSRARLQKTMKHLGYSQDHFIHLVSGEDVPEMKPSVLAYKTIINMSGLPPENNLYVGDRISADIIPAKAAGMHTILVGGESDEADYCMASIVDITSVI